MNFVISLSKTLQAFSLLLCIATVTSAFNLTTISFNDGYSHLFGESNLVRSPDDKSVRLLLNRYTGSGFISSYSYKNGFFSANIKLPAKYTAGVVVAFYTSNGDVFEKSHDELDFEFLGNVEGKPWRFQTNMYGNGSTHRGREERYSLWFDPTTNFHRYSILWTENKIVFYVDNVPIREIIRNEEMGGDFPSKPMALYATIWDASNWATNGGKYKVNYDYAPFVSEFTDLVLEGCIVDPIQQVSDTIRCSDKKMKLENTDFSMISPRQRRAMRKFREKFMYYSYCYDTWRYAVPPPECVIVPSEKSRFMESGRLKFGGRKPARRRSHRHGGSSTSSM